MASLNKHEPYGEVIGHKFARYEQGGKYFDGRGLEVDLNTGRHKSGGQNSNPHAGKSSKGNSETPPTGDNAGGTGSPTYQHKGAGYYIVRDADGNVVADKLRKAEAEEKVAELKAGDNEQLMSSLRDG